MLKNIAKGRLILYNFCVCSEALELDSCKFLQKIENYIDWNE
jgi:hypothetical protein